jgi:hypothetical protein
MKTLVFFFRESGFTLPGVAVRREEQQNQTAH